ncbi:CoA-transferase [Kineococcus radiotolerans]|uniref:CoA-transferase n=1 Tax=Kineococcus radiotolerans TaxID=131568 RepID=UPI003B831F8D
MPARPSAVRVAAQRAASACADAIPAGSRTRVGTEVAERKPTAEFEERTYLLEREIVADVGPVHARSADGYGNLHYRRTGGTPTR